MDKQISDWLGQWNQELGDGPVGRVAYALVCLVTCFGLLCAAVLVLAAVGIAGAAVFFVARFALSMLANAISPFGGSLFFAASPLVLTSVTGLLVLLLIAALAIVAARLWSRAIAEVGTSLNAGQALIGAAKLSGVIAVCIAFLYGASYYMLIGRGLDEVPLVIPFAGIVLLLLILTARLPSAFSNRTSRWLTCGTCVLLGAFLIALPLIPSLITDVPASDWLAAYVEILGIDQLEPRDLVIFGLLLAVLILTGLLVLAVSSRREPG